LSSVISTVAVAPAGIVAPFDPVTVFETDELKRWPTRLVFVHTREFDDSVISEPAGIDPTVERSDPLVPLVTVFPLAVVGEVGAGVDGLGVVVRGGVRTVVPELLGGVRVAGALATGPDAVGAPVVGTS
jgi:hypothetical protein